MASESGEGGISEATGDKFPATDGNGALNPRQNNDVKVDSVYSEISSLPDKKKDGTNKRKGKKDSMQVLKTTIIISAAVVAVAGVAFVISKKLREK